jgi:hypothetical protein
MNFGAGLFSNLKDGNIFVKTLGYISPFRYACEAMIRIFLKGLWYVDLICKQLAYTYEDQTYPIMLSFFIGFFFLAWIVMVIKARNL